MTAFELAEALETRFGNPLGPRQYDIIKQAIAMLRLQAEEIEALQSDVTEMVKGQ